jgi:hypothetical protein
MLSNKTQLIQSNRQKLNLIEADRRSFIAEQQRKINELHNYLDEKLRCIVAEYNKAVEPDLTKVKNNIDRCEEKAQEHKTFISEIQGMREVFSKKVIHNLLDNVSKSANMLNYYNHLKTINSTETHTLVYPNHAEDYQPVFDIDTNKEIEILANKFRILSTPGVATQQSYNRNIPEEEIGGSELSRNISHNATQQPSQRIPTLDNAASLGGVRKDERTVFTDHEEESKTKLFNTMPNPVFSNTQAKNTLVSVSSPVRKKLRIVRWLSNKIGEYDIENDFWTSVNAQVKKPFLPFSRTVYLPNQDMMVIGGLNDEIPNKPTFSSQTLKITEVPVSVYDSMYVVNQKSSMQTKRGCFTGLYLHGYVFAFGGLNYTHKVLRYCEKYNVEKDEWEEIAPMVQPRKNSSSCALTSDTIYVFGGFDSASAKQKVSLEVRYLLGTE